MTRDGRPVIALPDPPETPDTVTVRIHQLIDQPIRQSIIERYRLTREPGSVWRDENGEVA